MVRDQYFEKDEQYELNCGGLPTPFKIENQHRIFYHNATFELC
jgi:hypothetical protein